MDNYGMLLQCSTGRCFEVKLDMCEIQQTWFINVGYCLHCQNWLISSRRWLVQMWALSPNIFSLFSEHLLLTNVSMMDSYPAAHYAMINAFYSHCSRFVIIFGI